MTDFSENPAARLEGTGGLPRQARGSRRPQDSFTFWGGVRPAPWGGDLLVFVTKTSILNGKGKTKTKTKNKKTQTNRGDAAPNAGK